MVTLTLAELAASVPGMTQDAARLVARADIDTAAALLPDAEGIGFASLAVEAATESLRRVLILLGAIGIACALIALLLIRQKDLIDHENEETQP